VHEDELFFALHSSTDHYLIPALKIRKKIP